MNRYVATVSDYMTPSPVTIEAHEPIATAKTLMRRYSIRHLPVTRNGKLVGIVSDRDLALARDLVRGGDTHAIEEVMVTKPYAVDAGMPLHRAARDMARHKMGSAIALDGKKICGVLSATDTLEALADVLEGKHLRHAQEISTLRPSRGKTRLVAHPAHR